MKLLLKRIALRPTYTIGKLYIDGEYFCDTLEDTDRGLDQGMTVEEIHKVKDVNQDGCHTNDMVTAIPVGTYKVTLAIKSPKFSRSSKYHFCGGYLPRLCNVPGFDGVLMHIGNTPSHSAGCILVGKNKVVGQVLESTNTFRKLYAKLKEADDSGETIAIIITNNR